MADPKDKSDPNKPSATIGGDAAGTDKRSGRVSYDSRGNPIWEWQLETGVYSRDVNTQKLKKLDLGDLSIAETAIQKRPPGLGGTAPSAPKKPPMPGGGFNPYDNSSAGSTEGGGSNPYDNARALGKKLEPQVPPRESKPRGPRTPEELKRLEEWMKIRERVKNQKQDDDD